MLDTFRKTFYLVGRENQARWVALIAGAAVANDLRRTPDLPAARARRRPRCRARGTPHGNLRAYVGEVDQTAFLLWAALGIVLFFLLRTGY